MELSVEKLGLKLKKNLPARSRQKASQLVQLLTDEEIKFQFIGISDVDLLLANHRCTIHSRLAEDRNQTKSVIS